MKARHPGTRKGIDMVRRGGQTFKKRESASRIVIASVKHRQVGGSRLPKRRVVVPCFLECDAGHSPRSGKTGEHIYSSCDIDTCHIRAQLLLIRQDGPGKRPEHTFHIKPSLKYIAGAVRIPAGVFSFLSPALYTAQGGFFF